MVARFKQLIGILFFKEYFILVVGEGWHGLFNVTF
jgi:hypothetical protein